jgi:hypothetical protein
MSIVLKIATGSVDELTWDSCIVQWRNIVEYVKSHHPDWQGRNMYDVYKTIDMELKKYNGRLNRLDHNIDEIIFKTAEDLTFFLLRWS